MICSFYLKLTILTLSLAPHTYAMSTIKTEYAARRDDFNTDVKDFGNTFNAEGDIIPAPGTLLEKITKKQQAINDHTMKINKVLADPNKVSNRHANPDEKEKILKAVMATVLTDLRMKAPDGSSPELSQGASIKERLQSKTIAPFPLEYDSSGVPIGNGYQNFKDQKPNLYNHFRILQCATELSFNLMEAAVKGEINNQDNVNYALDNWQKLKEFNDLYTLSSLTKDQIARWFTEVMMEHQKGYTELQDQVNTYVKEHHQQYDDHDYNGYENEDEFNNYDYNPGDQYQDHTPSSHLPQPNTAVNAGNNHHSNSTITQQSQTLHDGIATDPSRQNAKNKAPTHQDADIQSLCKTIAQNQNPAHAFDTAKKLLEIIHKQGSTTHYPEEELRKSYKLAIFRICETANKDFQNRKEADEILYAQMNNNNDYSIDACKEVGAFSNCRFLLTTAKHKLLLENEAEYVSHIQNRLDEEQHKLY